MPQELEVVALTVDLPEYGLRAGDIGSIVLEHGNNGYEVEFTTISGTGRQKTPTATTDHGDSQ